MSIFDALAAPFPADAVSWRVGSTTQNKDKGMALAYLDARDVMDRFDAVCGADGWQCRYSHVGPTTVCEIGIRTFTNGAPELDERGAWKAPVPFEWIWKADGAGATDVEAEKGMLSDAFKRAAVKWGVGRYLYGLKSPWVELEPAGRSYRIKDSEYGKLRALLVREGAQGSQEPLRSQLEASVAAIPPKAPKATKDNPWEDRTLPAHEEFPGVPVGTRGKTAHFARTDGDDETFKAIRGEIITLESLGAVASFVADKKDAVAKMPASWRAVLRSDLDEQTQAIRDNTETEEETFPGDREAPVAGRNGREAVSA